MGAKVYANGREISGKSGGGNVIAAFPDVCLSPPSPPAGPVPIPYPNFSKDSDTSDGSKTVKAGGKEVMLKDKSSFKKCTGDEAATKSLGQGVVTHTLKGKVYFIAWSMDVEIEGENAVRHLDQTNSNHGSKPANNATPTPKLKSAAPSGPAPKPSPAFCKKTLKKHQVQSYKEQSKNVKKGSESHHVLQNSHFQYPRGTTIKKICEGYTEGDAPCIVLSGGTNPRTKHGRVSRMQKSDARMYRYRLNQEAPAGGNPKRLGQNPTYSEARRDAKQQLTTPPPGPDLSKSEAECILIEVDKKFTEMCSPKKLKDIEVRAPGQRGKGYKPSGEKTSGSGTL